ncbi:hypothetical protein VCHA50P415_200029 [Vibrio chagasii]|nr:hypothetical protein VCHA34P131_210030 [Vibrio chagasii]CAH6867580.1 hypothetical protein VCHA34P121_250030 [Vibrio chagasii]CAH7050804.1 hypothetical protein VCHA50P415_200029 [Vibrio chagasii]CAH7111953.1 hypothetical protein VCHA40O231_270014 [Vibrio chagasii]CAH7302212.1 hypothetical protein VCHA57P526_240029 [Vibrio chagasii]
MSFCVQGYGAALKIKMLNTYYKPFLSNIELHSEIKYHTQILPNKTYSTECTY